MIGRTLSHFKITAKLGEGGMGEVYRAEDTNLDREVAIKVLPAELATDPNRLARLEREAKALAALNHSNIASIHEIGREGDTHFLAMELVPGDTLAERLARGSLTVDQTLRYARGIARALEAAHARGVIHRDLKPLNVMITPEDEVKLLDFGLAKVMSATDTGDTEHDETLLAESELTAAGTVVGTTAYMSPEQIRGEVVDQRTDIWAFGCVLFEMLAEARPFVRSSNVDTLAAILKEDPDLEALREGTPDGIRNLVGRCLRKESGRRIHHIADARIEIEETLRDETPSNVSSGQRRAQEFDTGTDLEARAPKNWTKVAAGLVLIVALLVTIWKLLPGTPGPQVTDRTIAVLPFETLGQDGVSVFTEGIHGDMLTNLSKVADLDVTSRTSVMQFLDSEAPIPEIASQLGVAWILKGEVQETGGMVQVSARLVDARRDRQVWAESYQRELTAENLFQIQGELTRQIVDQLAVRLSPDEEQSVGVVPTEDLEAYRLYVQGRALLDPRTERDLGRAVDYFRQALNRDPIYSLAWGGLSNALALQGFYAYIPLEDVLPEARATARRALELDPDLAEGHTSLGIVRSLQREGPEAVESLRRSIELNPSFAPAHAWLGWVQDLLGNPGDALPAARRAVELNPLSPAYRAYLAEAYLANTDYKSALTEGERASTLQSDYALGRFMTGLALLHLGRVRDAEQAFERTLDLATPEGTPSRAEALAALGVAHSAAGDLDGARRRLAEIDGEAHPYAAGLVHAALGEDDLALERFLSVGEWGFTATPHIRYLFPDVLGPLRRDPRFEDVLRQVGRSFGVEPTGTSS